MKIDNMIKEFAHQNSEHLPGNFFDYYSYCEKCLFSNIWPDNLYSQGIISNIKFIEIADTAFGELHQLLCTKNIRYRDVRKEGQSFTKIALPIVAGYVAGTLGLSIGLATAAVAYFSLLVYKLGEGVFCNLYSSRNVGRGTGTSLHPLSIDKKNFLNQ